MLAEPRRTTLLVDGRAELEALIAASPHRTLAQAVASLTQFSHPETVAQTACKPVLRVVRARDIRTERKTIVTRNGQEVGLDDNKAPTDVFLWCNGLVEKPCDVQFNHVYADSQNPESYTCLANLCVTPSFLAKLTDTHRETRAMLQYRVCDLYRWRPSDRPEPTEPRGYADLQWRPCLPAVADVRATFANIAARRSKDRTTWFRNALGAFS